MIFWLICLKDRGDGFRKTISSFHANELPVVRQAILLLMFLLLCRALSLGP